MRRKKKGYVYIMASESGTLYVGVTSDISRRVWEHKNHIDPKSFTTKYNINRLVYYEEYDSIRDAIEREKQLKTWRRSKKEELIKRLNPGWVDLSLYF